jgi:hypothetical protein
VGDDLRREDLVDQRELLAEIDRLGQGAGCSRLSIWARCSRPE